jgi:ABC-type multidrug transport system fused ATPase/permease subunit
VLSNSGLNSGDLVTFMQYLSLVVTPLAMLAIVVPYLLRGDASARRIFEAYEIEPAVQDKPDARTLEPAAVQGRVVFENVSFAFRGADGQLNPAGDQADQPDHRNRASGSAFWARQARASRRWSTCCPASTM